MSFKIAASKDKAVSKSKGRKAPCGPVPAIGCSAKCFYIFIGSKTPNASKGAEFSGDDLVAIGANFGLSVVKIGKNGDKPDGYKCGKGEVTLGSAKSWYKWGHPNHPDEQNKAKPDSYFNKIPAEGKQKILDCLG